MEFGFFSPTRKLAKIKQWAFFEMSSEMDRMRLELIRSMTVMDRIAVTLH
jgi:hypothetical protein